MTDFEFLKSQRRKKFFLPINFFFKRSRFLPVIEINFSSLCQIGAGKYFIKNERRIYPSKRYLEGNNRAYHSPEPGPTGSSKFHNHFQLIGNNVKPWLN